MNCHECARAGIERSAIGLCRFCSVGLCKDHLVASYVSSVWPKYACDHDPDRAFAGPARPSERSEPQAHPRDAVRP
jgi:hypothetical protein